jgi:hypothetical protein
MTDLRFQQTTDGLRQLLPCAFCGCTAIAEWAGFGTQADIVCEDCGCERAVQVRDVPGCKDAEWDETTFRFDGATILMVNRYLALEWNERANTGEIETLKARVQELETALATYRDTNHVLRETLRAVQASLAWQLIETAPKDGTRLILGWDDVPALPMHYEVGRFRSGTGNGSGWCNTYGHSFNGAPTHWMLPPTSTALSQASVTDGAACSGMDQIKRGMEEYQHLDSGRNSHD